MSALAPHFQEREAFAPRGTYRLLPFRFGRLDDARYVVTNDVGEFVVLPREELEAFVGHRLSTTSATYRALKAKHMLFDDDSGCALDLLAIKQRTRMDHVAEFTALHIFVVTLRCDHSCHYCQVSRQTEDRSAFDMREEDADRALSLAFRSPARALKIEFQGGEPLLNFPLIRHIVERAVALNGVENRDLQFVIATSLSKLTDEHLAFAKAHRIFFSTSLDGPRGLHEANRPLRGGSSYDAAIDGIARVRRALGAGAVSALMTTSPRSLPHVEAIIDEYVAQGFDSIFLRSLSPYGFAVRTSLIRRYDADDWFAFYTRGLSHILDWNRRGVPLREDFTAILLQKMFAPRGSSYVDLQSPAGIGIGAVVYNYDGTVYASDEGRMLAEMGDFTFRLGTVRDDYTHLFGGETLLAPLEDSLLEAAPQCSDCPFLPYCGADPVFHRATQQDYLGHKAFSSFCTKQMGILRHVITLLEDDPSASEILRSWL